VLIDVLAVVSALGLLITWGLYPAVVGILASFRRKRAPAPDVEWPTVSVVIASREPEEAIRTRVANILATRYPTERLEVIVASGRDGDAGDSPAQDARIRHVRAAGSGKALALNAGVEAATGEVIVFADTYQRFDENTIPRLVSAVDAPGTGAASGRLELAPGTPSLVASYWAFERWLRRMEAGLHSAVGATGAVWAIRRELWQPLRPGLILDDVYTPMRIVLAGQRVAFRDDALAWETRTPTPAQEYSRKVRTLTGVVQLCIWLPGVLLPLRNPIWLQFVCHKLLRMLTPYKLAILAAWLLAVGAGAVEPTALLVTGAVAGATLLWFAVTRRPWAARIRRLATEGVLLQFAVLIAGINGLRGHWRVWDA